MAPHHPPLVGVHVKAFQAALARLVSWSLAEAANHSGGLLFVFAPPHLRWFRPRLSLGWHILPTAAAAATESAAGSAFDSPP
mmetsp:Transcript_22766/g.63230  ORF Transcript_22766/g.63230 Transcript_22766/m.63230 type:complete len:82 (+) Transcript_22766:2584-2829(+)